MFQSVVYFDMALDTATLLERSKISKKVGVAADRLESWELVSLSTEEIKRGDFKRSINWKNKLLLFFNSR